MHGEKKAQNPELYKLLQENNMSITTERFKIADYMMKQHLFSAQDLVDNFTEISRASLFRTINIFSEIGYIRKVLVPHKAEYYEIRPEPGDHHEHMICIVCNGVTTIEMCKAHQEIEKTAKEKDFKLREYSIGVIGTCKDCCK